MDNAGNGVSAASAENGIPQECIQAVGVVTTDDRLPRLRDVHRFCGDAGSGADRRV